MKKFLAGCLAIGVLVAAQSAGAADLSRAPLYKAPPPQYAKLYSWSGLYLGANGGGGWGDSNWAGLGNADVSGGLVGGTAGYNWQFGQAVLGLEGDIDWSGLKGSCPDGACTTSESWLSTVRGRAGYSFGRFMPYVTGGFAFGDIQGSDNKSGTSGSSTNAGWALGGGVEFALPDNWSAKAEYLHVDLGNCAACSGTPNQSVSLHDNVFRAGVNYHFGWGK